MLNKTFFSYQPSYLHILRTHGHASRKFMYSNKSYYTIYIILIFFLNQGESNLKTAKITCIQKIQINNFYVFRQKKDDCKRIKKKKNGQ